MKILALDLSLTPGFAYGGGGVPVIGTFALPAGEHNLDRAMVQLREWVVSIVTRQSIELVAIEAALRVTNRKHSAYSAFALTSLSAVAREGAYRNGSRVTTVNVQSWRRAILGNGNMPGEEAKKKSMFLCDKMGWPCNGSDDAAEAAMIWMYTLASNDPKWNPERVKR